MSVKFTSKGLADGTDSTKELEFNVTGVTTGTTRTITVPDSDVDLGQTTAKAWVNFNGTGTVAIRDSYNVSSITDNSTGRYYVNFATNMANANYSAVTSSNTHNSSVTAAANKTVAWGKTTSRFEHRNFEGSVNVDSSLCDAIVFGD